MCDKLLFPQKHENSETNMTLCAFWWTKCIHFEVPCYVMQKKPNKLWISFYRSFKWVVISYQCSNNQYMLLISFLTQIKELVIIHLKFGNKLVSKKLVKKRAFNSPSALADNVYFSALFISLHFTSTQSIQI